MISIIVPVYNVEKYVGRCIESIQRQTYRNLEIILVDDGATDGSGILCDRYAESDSRISVIHKENGGLSSARNAGLNKARGEYLCFVDSDDWVDDRYVEALCEAMTLSGADMAACRFCKALEGKPAPRNKDSGRISVLSDELCHHAITETTFAGYAWNKLWKTEIVRSHGLCFDERIFNGEDLPFTVEYLRYCRSVVFTEAELYFYNVRPMSITTSRGFTERAFTILYAREKVLSLLKENSPACVDIETAAYLSHLAKFQFLLEPISDQYPDQYQEVKDKIARHRDRIMNLQGVALRDRLKLFAMVRFSGILGGIYRRFR